MNQEQLLEVIKALKLEILDLLQNTNLANDRATRRALLTINDTYNQLGIAVEEVIPKEILLSYYSGVDEATKALSAAGVQPVGGLTSSITNSGVVAQKYATQVHMNAIAEITDNTMLDFKAAIRTAKRSANVSIESALSSVKKDLQGAIIKGNARQVTIQRVAESFAKEGMTSFITVDGKRLPLDFYSETVTRTNIKSANVQGAAARYRENGVELYTVTGNTPTCHQCHAYRGIVFSMVDDKGDFPYLDPKTFPVHPNCQCSIMPFVIEFKTEKEIEEAKEKAKTFEPEKDTRPESQRKAYDEQQALHRKNNAIKKEYASIKAVMGDLAPKTLGGYKRMKNSNSDNYVQLKEDYRDALKAMK